MVVGPKLRNNEDPSLSIYSCRLSLMRLTTPRVWSTPRMMMRRLRSSHCLHLEYRLKCDSLCCSGHSGYKTGILIVLPSHEIYLAIVATKADTFWNLAIK